MFKALSIADTTMGVLCEYCVCHQSDIDPHQLSGRRWLRLKPRPGRATGYATSSRWRWLTDALVNIEAIFFIIIVVAQALYPLPVINRTSCTPSLQLQRLAVAQWRH